jgi:uncharacterized protein
MGEKGISAFGMYRHKNAFQNLSTGFLLGILFYSGSFIVSVIRGEIYFGGFFQFNK